MNKNDCLKKVSDVQTSIVNTLYSMMGVKNLNDTWGTWAEIASSLQRDIIALGTIKDDLRKDIFCKEGCKDKECKHEVWE